MAPKMDTSHNMHGTFTVSVPRKVLCQHLIWLIPEHKIIQSYRLRGGKESH